jgi:hypothetical protein
MNAMLDVPADIEAVLNYTRNTGIRPVNCTFDPPPGLPRNSGEIDARTVKIYDARRVTGLSLDALVLVSTAKPVGSHPTEDL